MKNETKLRFSLKDKTGRKLALVLLLIVVMLFVPYVISSDYVVKIINNALLYSTIALSTNIIVGDCGLLDFGRSAFCAMGGYCSAILMQRLGLPFALAFLCAGLFAMLCGLLLGFLSKGAGGDFMNLMTIAFAEIFRLLLQNLPDLTGGTLGLFKVPNVSFFGFEFNTHRRFYYFALGLLIVCYILIRRIHNSKMGRAFEAIRDDEIAASFYGIDVRTYKMLCFTVASFFTGLAGSAMVHYTNFASPQNYSIDQSLIIMEMVVLGGMGSMPGAILGAFILTVVPELSRSIYEYRMLFTGVTLVLLMLFCPDGILGRNGVKDKIVAAAHRKAAKKAAAEGGTSNG